MTAKTATRHRILIGAASFADAKEALSIADRLAESLVSELGGMLMEDSAIRDLIAAPGQRVITQSGSVVAAPSPARLHAALDSDVKAFQQALGKLADLRRAAWSFERRQGELVAGLCEAAIEWDLLLLGQRRQSIGQGQVVLVTPRTGISDDLASLTQDLARRLGVDTVTVALEGSEGAGANDVTWATETEVLRWISRARAAVVIADLVNGPFRTRDQLRELVEAARAPVLVAGAAGLERSNPGVERPGNGEPKQVVP